MSPGAHEAVPQGGPLLQEKCAIERRAYPPGQHGQRRGRRSLGYGPQLREKQKVKRIYGVLEKQFRNYFKDAERRRGVTGDNLLVSLERRLDNVVYNLGLCLVAGAGSAAGTPRSRPDRRRQDHDPFLSGQDRSAGRVKEGSRKNEFIRASVETARGRGIPSWLELDPDNFVGKVTALPTREDIKLPVEEQLIVELYSR